MAVVKNLMVRAGVDFSAITKQSNKAKSAMSGMQASVTQSCSRMSSAVSGMKKVLGALGTALSVAAVVSFSKSAKEAYDAQIESEAKLAQVMRNTIGASNEEIKAIKDLTAAQQALGVVGDEIQLAGAQELATYVTMTSTLETLIPVMNDMVAQPDWTPDKAVSLWTRIADPAEEWPEWSQPIGAHDAYQTGDKVSHNGKHWICTVDGNVWEPGVYGWTQADD